MKKFLWGFLGGTIFGVVLSFFLDAGVKWLEADADRREEAEKAKKKA